MDAILWFAAWGALVLSVAVLVYWFLALTMIAAGVHAAPRIEEGLFEERDSEAWPRVSIVIPAHDEAEFISDAVRSILASDYPDFEVIVVADRCVDDTPDLVRQMMASDARLRLIENDECPDGWSGKCHASWRGAMAATGDWILFTDADTLFDERLLRASVGLALRRRLDFLSLLGRLRQRYAFEKTTQPVAAMALMKMYPIRKINREDPARRRPFANGQFMLIRHETYHAFGTHERVRDAILEDLKIARRLTRDGYRIALTMAPRLFFVRMYEDEEDFRRGWKRILIEGANRNVPRMRAAARNLSMLSWCPAFVVVAITLGVWTTFDGDRSFGLTVIAIACVAAIAQLVAVAWAYRLQGASLSTIWRYPLGCWRVAGIYREAVRDLKEGRGIEWARMQYAVDEKTE
ncbi:MAG: glycosyltransferase [Phycisphaerales bacterium]